jgi:hypothetical protein
MARALTLWMVALGTALGFAQETKTEGPKDFKTLHAELCKREKWETVPWRTDLYDTQAASIKDKKPIFIWAMDGQTLGCT